MIRVHCAVIHLPATVSLPACQLYVGIQRHLVSLNLRLRDPSVVLLVRGSPLSWAADIGKCQILMLIHPRPVNSVYIKHP